MQVSIRLNETTNKGVSFLIQTGTKVPADPSLPCSFWSLDSYGTQVISPSFRHPDEVKAWLDGLRVIFTDQTRHLDAFLKLCGDYEWENDEHPP